MNLSNEEIDGTFPDNEDGKQFLRAFRDYARNAPLERVNVMIEILM